MEHSTVRVSIKLIYTQSQSLFNMLFNTLINNLIYTQSQPSSP